MVATFSTLEGHTHQGDQGGSPSADFQSPRKPPGSPQPASLDGGRQPHPARPPASTHIPAHCILPNSHHLVDKPTPRTFRTVQSCDPHVEDPDGSKRGKPRAPQSRKPATLPARITRSPAHGVDKVFPKAPGGKKVTQGSWPGAAGRHRSQADVQAQGLPWTIGLAGIGTTGIRELRVPSRRAGDENSSS